MGSTDTVQSGVSSRALYVARLIDRLEPGGRYVIELLKPTENTDVWQISVSQAVTIKKQQLVRSPAENGSSDNSGTE